MPTAEEVLRDRIAEVGRTWQELCRWDPELPPDVVVTDPETVLIAVAEALGRPQPLGWGIDPALVGPAEQLAATSSTPDAVASLLVCLRVALHEHLTTALPPDVQWEAARRIDMIVDRLVAHGVRESAHHLRTLAFVDPLTGLPNRRAFEDDLDREISRVRRHGRVLSVAMLDVDGLKAQNDRFGHEAGDDLLRTVAILLRSALRNEDVAYRVGGDEFAVLFPDVDAPDANFLRERLASVGAPSLSVGIASSARDPLERLQTLADARMYESRRAIRLVDT